MADNSVVIIGLPGSGKTTYLAALWHLINARDIPTALKFASLGKGNLAHLNAIAARWREAKIQDRTAIGGVRIVSMNLKNAQQESLTVTFPDVPGEVYRQMWEDRECELEIAETLKARAVLLFIHADNIEAPKWVVDEVAMCKLLGVEMEEGSVIPWHPKLAPTQVQLVDCLQMLSTPPLYVGPRKLAIMLSAWDKACGEELTPEQFVTAKMPLMRQYLESDADRWDFRIYGLSAQGGDYDSAEPDARPSAAAESARQQPRPSVRIRVVGEDAETNDLTEPLAWLME